MEIEDIVEVEEIEEVEDIVEVEEFVEVDDIVELEEIALVEDIVEVVKESSQSARLSLLCWFVYLVSEPIVSQDKPMNGWSKHST